jgi:drug/metabolite transporter (DMT)-like permease
LQIAGFALGMIGIGLIAQAKEQGQGRRGLALAVLAGLGFGAFFVLFASVRTHAILWPLCAARLASCSAATILARGDLRSLGKSRALLPLLLGAGVLDVGGNAFFVLATHSGRLDIAAVLASLYPASTILLARIVLRERLNGLQMTGIAAALLAIVLITLG